MGKVAPEGDELLTTAQVAELKGWSITSINRWVRDRKLPTAHKVPGKTGAHLFYRSTIEQFAADRSAAVATDRAA